MSQPRYNLCGPSADKLFAMLSPAERSIVNGRAGHLRKDTRPESQPQARRRVTRGEVSTTKEASNGKAQRQ